MNWFAGSTVSFLCHCMNLTLVHSPSGWSFTWGALTNDSIKNYRIVSVSFSIRWMCYVCHDELNTSVFVNLITSNLLSITLFCVCTRASLPHTDRPGGRVDHSEGHYTPDRGSQLRDDRSNRSHTQRWNPTYTKSQWNQWMEIFTMFSHIYQTGEHTAHTFVCILP